MVSRSCSCSKLSSHSFCASDSSSSESGSRMLLEMDGTDSTSSSSLSDECDMSEMTNDSEVVPSIMDMTDGHGQEYVGRPWAARR